MFFDKILNKRDVIIDFQSRDAACRVSAKFPNYNTISAITGM